mgnify:CR=1 FL=1
MYRITDGRAIRVMVQQVVQLESLRDWKQSRLSLKIRSIVAAFSIRHIFRILDGRRHGNLIMQLVEHLESLTDDEDNHFTREDVKDALKAIKADNKLLSTMASREWIEKQTKVDIPPNKRNGRKREQHIKMVNAMRIMKRDVLGEDEYKNNGRPDKQKIVEEWQESHPAGKKADCIRETGLSKPTVYKWWK